jgi:CDP-6-deoxy-D-xylo-4-hexulose-3-dehydrase
MAKQLKYSGRVYDKREIESLKKSADEFWLTHGRFCDEFQEKLKAYLGVEHCLVVNSGSSALLLAFATLTSHQLGELRIKRGDEVITTAACFPTTIAPVIQYGAVPVFVDITIPQYNIDTACLEAALSAKTKAVILAHTLGNPFNIKEIVDFCSYHNLWLIEDTADALGGDYIMDGESHKLGSFGDISTFSFYPAHQITTGQGGAAATSNDMLAKIMISLRDWGRACHCRPGQDNACHSRFSGQYGTLPSGYDHKYVYSEFGYNLAMTDMQGAIGTVQMDKLPYFKMCRKNNWKRLLDFTKDLDELFHLPENEVLGDPCWFGFMLTIKSPDLINRTKFQTYLENAGIQTRLLFAGNIVRQPCFDFLQLGKDYKVVGVLPSTDWVTDNGLWVGVYPGLKPEDIEYMGTTIKRFVRDRVR